MTTFDHPINPKYLPALKVTKWPYAEVQYEINARGVEIFRVGFDPKILSYLTDIPWLVAEIEQATVNNATVPDTGVNEALADWKLNNNW